MNNQKSFSLQMADLIAKTKGDGDKVIRGILLRIDGEVDFRSPVGDGSYWKRPPPPGYAGGRFRGNWQMSLSSPASGETGVLDKDGSATLAAHAAVVSQMKGGDVAYLVNNAPYAKRIEDGWSRQAPAGVVGLTVLNFQKFVDDAIKGLK